MQYYPLFLNLSKMNCLVLGAGEVGRRKIASLQKAKARSILVLDTSLTFEKFSCFFMKEHGVLPQVHFETRAFCEKDLCGIRLVFAATRDNKTNGLLAKLCEEKEILCNVIEEAGRGDFLVPAHLDYDNLIIALSTSGTSPAFAKALKEDLSVWLNRGYAPFLCLMQQIRSFLLKTEPFSLLEAQERKVIFRAFVQKNIREQIFKYINEKHIDALQCYIYRIILENIHSTQKEEYSSIENCFQNTINWKMVLQKNIKT